MLEQWPNRQYLVLPLFYLARHSIELHLKDAILEFAKTDDVMPDLEGHGLMQLWNQFKDYMDRWGTPADDEWGVYIEKLMNHLHQHDPDGERFRYPENKKREPFGLTRVDLEDLVRAHWHIHDVLRRFNEYARRRVSGLGLPRDRGLHISALTASMDHRVAFAQTTARSSGVTFRHSVTKRHAEYTPDYQAKATAAIEEFARQ